ncbi:hypothetical protein ACFLZB_00480 [Nanoarchaeota archaeon]
MSIPLLIVDEGKGELSDLASNLCRFHLDPNVMPYLAEDVDDALDVFNEHRGSLRLTLLDSEGQETHDALVAAGYRGRFLVYGQGKNLQKDWEDREVGFLDPSTPIEQAAGTILDKLPYFG